MGELMIKLTLKAWVGSALVLPVRWCGSLLLGIMAILDSSWSLKSSKRGPKSSSSTSQNTMSKLSITDKNPQILKSGCRGDWRARYWCLTLAMRVTRKQSTCCLPSGFWKIPVHSVKELEVPLMCHKSLGWDCSPCFLQDLQNHHGQSSLAGHQSHQSQCHAAWWRKWIDNSCAQFVFK